MLQNEDDRTYLNKQMESLFTQYYHRLFLYALNIVNNEEDAKDIVSDVFATIWQQWQNDNRSSSELIPSSYLYKLTRSRCIDSLRHDQVKENYVTFLENTTDLAVEDSLEYEQRIQKITKLIERLYEPGKSILKCCYFNKMSYEETAFFLKLSLAVVKRNMVKVFKLLREELNKGDNKI